MADLQWVFTLQLPHQASGRDFTFEHINGRTVRFFRDQNNDWEVMDGDWLEADDNVGIGQIAFRGGAVVFEAHVRDITIQPSVPAKLAGIKSSALEYLAPKTDKKNRKAFFLRPGDTIHFGTEDLSVHIDLKRQSKGRPSLSTNVEIKSSEPPRDATPENNAVDDDDDLDAIKKAPTAASTPDQPAFSTAPQAILETPTAVKTSPIKNKAKANDDFDGVKVGRDESVEDGSDTDPEADDEPSESGGVELQQSRDPQPSIATKELSINTPIADSAPKAEPSRSESPVKAADAGPHTADDGLYLSDAAAAIPKDEELPDLDNHLDRKPSVPSSFVPINGASSSAETNNSSGKRKKSADDNEDESTETPTQPRKKCKGLQPSWSGVSSRATPKSGSSQKSKSKSKTTSPELTSTSRPDDAYTGSTPRILFTNTDILFRDKNKYSRFLSKQDAKSVDHLEKSNFLCVGTGELKMTAKLLISLVMDKTIVTDEWVADSAEKGYLLATDIYLHESLHGDETVDRSELFADQAIYITPALKKLYGGGFGDIQTILSYAGAEETISNSAKDIDADSSAIIVGLDATDKDVAALVNKGLKCYKKDLITTSILEGQLLTDNEEYMIEIPSVEATSTGGRKKKKAAK